MMHQDSAAGPRWDTTFLAVTCGARKRLAGALYVGVKLEAPPSRGNSADSHALWPQLQRISEHTFKRGFL